MSPINAPANLTGALLARLPTNNFKQVPDPAASREPYRATAPLDQGYNQQTTYFHRENRIDMDSSFFRAHNEKNSASQLNIAAFESPSPGMVASIYRINAEQNLGGHFLDLKG